MRFLNSLRNPKLVDYHTLVLPRGSMVHWVDYEGLHLVGPPQTEGLLARSTKKMVAKAISAYPNQNVRQGWVVATQTVAGLITKYDSENPNIKRMTQPVSSYTTNELMPIYVYGLLHKTYRYKNYVDSELNRWMNYHYTVFQRVLEISKTSNRNQFIELDAPKSFPSYQNLKKGESGIDKSNIRYLPLKDHWILTCLWNLIANNGNDFIFSGFSPEDFNKVNIIWKCNSQCMVMNLGLVLGFCTGEKPLLTPDKLQRRMVQMFIKLNTVGIDGEVIDDDLISEVSKFDSIEDPIEGAEENEEEEEEEELDEYLEETKIQDGTSLNNPFKNMTLTDTRIAPEPADFKKVDDIVLDDDDGEIADEDNESEFLALLDAVSDNDEDVSGYKAYVSKPITPTSVIEQDASKLVKAGVMSVGSFERLKRLASESMELPDPFKEYNSIADAAAVSLNDVTIPKKVKLPVVTNDLIDESMNYSSLARFNEQYIEEVHNKDILNAVMSIQRGGIIVKGYDIEKVETVNEKYNVHKVQIETLRGHVSTLSFKIPILESDGTFKCSGTRRIMRKQRGDIPIRKVNYDSTALTSYYNKMFVNRTDRKQFNFDHSIQNHVTASSIDKINGISEVKFDNVFDNNVTLPRAYTALSRKFNSFVCNGHRLYFNVNGVVNNFDNRLRRKDIIPLAVDVKSGKTSLYMSKSGDAKLFDASGNDMYTTLERFLNMETVNIPHEYAEVNLFGKKIPLVLILGYQLGFGNLLKTLKVKPRREARGKRIVLEEYEYPIRFNDEVLIFNRKHDPLASLIVNGLLRFKNSINTISVYDLDNKSIYNELFEEVKAPLKLLKECKDMFNLWVDPITEKILTQMGEPTDLVLLFIRAVELLLTDEHPESNDIGYMRDKGYERIAGMLYSELVKVTRDYNSKSLYSNNKLTINPEAVWFSIITDQTITLVEESNPIHSMKEKEIIIFSGQGGRSGTTMTAGARKYHKSNLGVISEATVDSGDAGAVIYNVADPNYTSVYGISDRVSSVKDMEGAKLLSPSGLLAPGGELDDPKRLNFTSVQNSQTTFCTHATPMPMRTGMEKMVHARASNMFSKIAKSGGKVIDVTSTSIMVEYENGKKEGFNIGKVFGRWGGDNIPHVLKSNVKVGDTFNKGACLYYNDHYFTTDVTDNNAVTFKNHVLARVALVENYDVYEDSAAMSKTFSSKLTTRGTHIRNIRLNAENTIKNLVKEGDTVSTDSILCTIHSSQLNDEYFSGSSLDSLNSISSLNPTSKYAGVIDKINIIYTADLESLTEELADVIRSADSKLYRESKRTGGGVKNGRVDVGFKIDGVNMTGDEIVIQVYITETIDMSIADKIVVGNQLKATVGRYWNEPQVSEDNVPIDLMFSAKSVDNRIVLDAEKIGTTNTLLIELTKRFIESYDK